MNKKSLWMWVGIAVVVVIIIIVVAMGNKGTPAATPSTASTGSIPSTNLPFVTTNAPAPTVPYTAATDGFSIDFAGTPQVMSSTFHSPTAGYVPLTEYRDDVSAANAGAGANTENAYYTVYVYHYPDAYEFAADYLNTALQTYTAAVAKNFPGSQLVAQQSGQFLGQNAITGIVNVPLQIGAGSPSNTPDYVLITLNGHDVYIVSTYGIDSNTFTAFINSFQLAG
jgi:hypothetical protein